MRLRGLRERVGAADHGPHAARRDEAEEVHDRAHEQVRALRQVRQPEPDDTRAARHERRRLERCGRGA
jgi:hypothetical protein